MLKIIWYILEMSKSNSQGFYLQVFDKGVQTEFLIIILYTKDADSKTKQICNTISLHM